MRKFSISSQLLLSLIVLLGLSYNAHGNSTSQSKKSTKNITYKVENCDCLGFSDDIPTFLSDLPGATNIDIEAQGKTLDEAEKSAQNMCVETYRNFASIGTQEKASDVTQTGCQAFKTAANGEWESI